MNNWRGKLLLGPFSFPNINNWKIQEQTRKMIFIVWSSSCNPLLGRTRYRGKCWAIIRLSRIPEPPGDALHGEFEKNDEEWRQRQNRKRSKIDSKVKLKINAAFNILELRTTKMLFKAEVLNPGSANALEVHECLSGYLQTTIQSRKSASFIRPFGALFNLIAPQLTCSCCKFFFGFGDSSWGQAGT